MNCKGNSIGSLIKAFSFQSTHTFLAFHCYLGPIFFFWLYKTGFFLLFLFFNHYLSEVNSAQPLIGQKSQQCSSWTVDGSRLENPGGKYSCQICPDQFDGQLTGPDRYMVNDYMQWSTIVLSACLRGIHINFGIFVPTQNLEEVTQQNGICNIYMKFLFSSVLPGHQDLLAFK